MVDADAMFAHVSLRPIDDDNRDAVMALDVTPAQGHFVAGVARSLADAHDTPGACPWYRAIYRDETAVGFVMISDNVPPERTEFLGPYFLWRLLIDVSAQRQGIGTAGLDLVVQYVRSRPAADIFYTSVGQHPGSYSPLPFYLGYGFRSTGRLFDDEQVLELPL
jgi:diamine N-acetyltransferase